MIELQRVNITLPKKLVKRARVLIDEGLFSNFSELIREGIKDEIELNKSQIEKIEILKKWFKEEKQKGFDTSKLPKEDIIKRLRRSREQLWEEKYKLHYG